MASISTTLKIAIILTTAISLNVTLCLGDEGGNPFHPSLNTGRLSGEYIVLAQNTAAPATAPEVKRDTVFIERPAPAVRHSHSVSKEDMADMVERRDHFASMQSTGFGLLMGGIGCGAAGLLLMITGANEMSNSTEVDQYGDTQPSTKGEGPFIVGYLALVIGTPALVTTGIILNRVGNHRKNRLNDEIEEGGGHVDVNVGLNSVRLSYSF